MGHYMKMRGSVWVRQQHTGFMVSYINIIYDDKVFRAFNSPSK
jgi:hypothetical protein